MTTSDSLYFLAGAVAVCCTVVVGFVILTAWCATGDKANDAEHREDAL